MRKSEAEEGRGMLKVNGGLRGTGLKEWPRKPHGLLKNLVLIEG